ncbi:branched-chain amino acid ABC transporter permease [Bradyrhizobium sp. 62B]|uniref:branched-chain amino acid ABC transporter permease n=1 Tax=Bradyrhizobium sp. 62B TaxID=2898442 RepID=UPI002557DAE3|nr:branched-chain amino acid ABC transporter permease [Bradyrhizobium sp. 62B]
MVWFEQIFQGALLGGYYALIACGLSFMFSVMGVINLAHGSFAVAAAFGLWAMAEYTGISPLYGWIVVLPAMALTGVAFQGLVLDRSTRAGFLIPVLSTFGLSICIDNILFEQFGADTRSLAPYIDDLSYESWELPNGVFVGKLAAYIFLAAVTLIGGLQVFLSRTHLGRAIRATAADRDTAGLVGIDAGRINIYATAIAMVTVGIAGATLAMRATFNPYSGGPQLIFAFEAAVIGGTGSLWGTLIGGIVLGVAQSVGAQLNPQGFLIAGHAVFLIVLVARTSFGRLVDRWRLIMTPKAAA